MTARASVSFLIVAGSLAALAATGAEYSPLFVGLRKDLEPEARPPAATAKPAQGDGVVKMEPLYVTEFRLPSSAQSDVAIPRYRIFALKEGGTFARHVGRRFTTEVKFQYNPKHGGWDLLSISW